MLSVVLHRPIYPRNVGMCARALANLGLSELSLVAPQFDLENQAANLEMRQGAAGAQSILQKMKVYGDLEAYKKSAVENVRIAWSAKLAEAQTFSQVANKFQAQEVSLHFGCEDDGLNEQETEFCHFICKLPITGEFDSMNISHAVMLASFLVQRNAEPIAERLGSNTPAPFYETLPVIEEWLKAVGFQIDGDKQNMAKKLNRILLSQVPTAEELKIFDAVVRQTVRKLK